MKPIIFTQQEKSFLKPVLDFAKVKKAKLYLVGGILRDKLIGRQKANLDFDFCLKRYAISFGRQLAKRMSAGFVVLDEQHGACRVVKKLGGGFCTFDFSDFRGETLEIDLLHRDFTVNTLAMELEKVFSGACDLIDCYGAQGDIKKKIIAIAHKSSFSEDPLRILRAFSYACILGFSIDKQTFALAKKEKSKLTKVSFERIRDELFKILDSKNSYNYIAMLDEQKIIEILFPELKSMRGIGQGPYHHLDVWQHTLESLRQMDLLFKQTKNEEIKAYLEEIISAERKRRAVLKLAALLHDIGKPKALRYEEGKTIFHGHEWMGIKPTEEIAKRLKLSNDEISVLRKIVRHHLRPGFLADHEVLTSRAKFRYFRDAGNESVSTLLMSIADQRATKGPLTTPESRAKHEKVVFGLIRESFRKAKEKKPARLINGDDLIREFKLEPSPLFGKILSEIEELQAIGKVKTKIDALKAAKKMVL
ncbi:MAG: HD domain-containing protein [Candidatus Omnitrophica bacterium]|nr:HD domain-containing protein [Candidatus Omnitrophota bacterium]